MATYLVAQFDVHPNTDPTTAADIPWLLELQSNAFEASGFRIAAPLVRIVDVRRFDTRLNPEFEIAGERFALLPLDLVSIPVRELRGSGSNLDDDGDRIVAALDLVFGRV